MSLAPAALEPANSRANVARQHLLAGYTDAWVYRKNGAEGFGYVSAVLSVAGIAVAAALYDHDAPWATAWVVGFSASTLVTTGSLFATRDTRVDILEMAPQFNAGVTMLGLAVADDPGSVPRLTSGASAGAGFGEALLLGINSLARRTPTSAVRSHRDRLRRGAVSEAELRHMERDFLAADVPFGQGVLALPYGIGAVVGLVPALDPKRSSDERIAAGTFGGILGLSALFTALAPTLVPSYRNALNGAGLAVLPGAGSFTLRYRF